MEKAIWFLATSILVAALLISVTQYAMWYHDHNSVVLTDRYVFEGADGYITAVADKQEGVIRYATGQTWDFTENGATISKR